MHNSETCRMCCDYLYEKQDINWFRCRICSKETRDNGKYSVYLALFRLNLNINHTMTPFKGEGVGGKVTKMDAAFPL